jgi:hypothetical protein
MYAGETKQFLSHADIPHETGEYFAKSFGAKVST